MRTDAISGPEPDSVPMPAETVVRVDHAGWHGHLGDPEACVIAAVEAAFAVAPAAARDRGELTVLLGGDEFVQNLNRVYRGQDRPTNVLAFPAAAPGLLGDIALALETVIGEAERQGKAASDHTRHLVVHGVLHLLGFDHESDGAAAEMENLEIAALARLGIADPYALLDRTDGAGS